MLLKWLKKFYPWYLLAQFQNCTEKWFKSNHPYIKAFLVYLGGYFGCHNVIMLGKSPVKCRQHPDMTIAVDWDAKSQSNKQSLLRYISHLMGKPAICLGKNKDIDQLHGNREADQRLCFRYTDSTFHLLPKSEISSF